MRRVIRIGLFVMLAFVASAAAAPSQPASGSPAKPNPAPTPIPLAKVPLEAQSALASPVLQGVQSVVDSIERTRQAAESGQAHVLTLQSRISEEEARVRTALSSIEQGENRALKGLFVRDSPPIWSLKTGLGTEWEEQGGSC